MLLDGCFLQPVGSQLATAYVQGQQAGFRPEADVDEIDHKERLKWLPTAGSLQLHLAPLCSAQVHVVCFEILRVNCESGLYFACFIPVKLIHFFQLGL